MSGGEAALLTAEEVAERFRIRPRRVHELVRAGLLPAVHLGRQVRISAAALEAFIASGGRGWPGGWRKTAAEGERRAEA